MTTYEIEEKIVAMLKTVYDPEIPVNVYDLGLRYKIDDTENNDSTLQHPQPLSTRRMSASTLSPLKGFITPPSTWCSSRNGTKR